jgi:adenylate kinase
VAGAADGLRALRAPSAARLRQGTQAALLATRLGVPAISTGEMLRQAVADGSELGPQVAAIMASGALVDDATMAEVVRERLAQADARGGFLLDGYPRTLPQAETLEEILARTASARRGRLLEVPEASWCALAPAAPGAADDRRGDRGAAAGLRGEDGAARRLLRRRGLLRRIDGNRR